MTIKDAHMSPRSLRYANNLPALATSHKGTCAQLGGEARLTPLPKELVNGELDNNQHRAQQPDVTPARPIRGPVKDLGRGP